MPAMGKEGASVIEMNSLIGYDLRMTTGQGSAGNVIAALASFFIPGLGQLIQGRPIRALIFFVAAAALWIIMLGWIIHIWAIIDAALWKPKS